jgi:hypothetical protein
MIEAKTTNLRTNEIDAIHRANVLYWRGGQEQSREARTEYKLRQVRLQEMRELQLAQRLS